MNKVSRLFLLTIGLLLLSTSSIAETAETGQKLDSVAAIVNDDVITQNELNNKFEMFKASLANSNSALPEDSELRSQVLEHLIDQKVELQTAARAGIDIDDSSLDQSIKEIAARNDMSVDEFQQYMQNNGYAFKDYREDVREQIIVEKLLQREIGSRINISKQEVDKYLNSLAYEQQNVAEYKLRDILVALPEIPSSDEMHTAQKKSDAIMAQIEAGEDFEKIAIAQSNGGEALKGGDLGWRRIEEVPTVFSERVQVMDIGEVIGPIRAANGFHIVKLEDVRGSQGRHYTTETHVRHILLKTDSIYGIDDIKSEITKIRDEIEAGMSFKEAATKYSQDPVSAANGGELGWVREEVLVPQFAKAMKELQVGIISEPVHSEFGWHIIEVLERREKDDTDEFQRAQIRKLVYDRKYQEQAQAWVKRMRDSSFVDVVA